MRRITQLVVLFIIRIRHSFSEEQSNNIKTAETYNELSERRKSDQENWMSKSSIPKTRLKIT